MKSQRQRLFIVSTNSFILEVTVNLPLDMYEFGVVGARSTKPSLSKVLGLAERYILAKWK